MEWNGEERRANNEMRNTILKELAETDDKNLKAVLLLLMGVLEATEGGIQRIEAKIDGLLRDEKQIRMIALNGHMEKHGDHHDWIEMKIRQEEEAEREKKSLWGAARRGFVGKLVELALTALAAAAGATWMMK